MELKVTDIGDLNLREIVSRLVKEFNPEKVYLFGSRARGDFTEDSDYDLVLIVSKEIADCRASYKRVAKVLSGSRIPTDVLLWDRDDFQNNLHLKASLPATVVREGQLLHVS